MHYIYKVVTLTEKNSNVVCLLNYLPTCDHFVKLSIKGLDNLRKKFLFFRMLHIELCGMSKTLE